MTKTDRMLALKFMSGNTRLNQGTEYMMHVNEGHMRRDGFPIGHTCDSNMSIPLYSSKELMQQRLITAFRLCGEID